MSFTKIQRGSKVLSTNNIDSRKSFKAFIGTNFFIIIAFFIFVAFSFSWILHVKPPFTSPDEGAHLSRADALRNGFVYLVSPDGKIRSGGEVDKSMNMFRSSYDKVIKGHDPKIADSLKNKWRMQNWSGENMFYSMPNTAFYFPAIYIPQALALQIGHALNLNIYSTYKLVSSITLLVIIITLLASWRITPIPAPALIVLTLPMTIFQFFSPTIDGLSFAFTILMMSLFVNIMHNTEEGVVKKNIFWLCAVIFILSSSRANLLPLTLLPLWIFFRTKNKASLIGFAITFIAVMSWTYFSIKTVQDNGMHHPGIEQIDVIKHYITHPIETFMIIFNTITDYQIISYYVTSFLGTLAWLDAPLTQTAYWFFGLTLLLMFLSNISFKEISKRKGEAALLVLFSLSIIALTFCALLVQWSSFPTLKVDGVQGRYFIIPMIILAYAIMDNPKLVKFTRAMTIIIAIASVYSVHLALESRYF